MLQSSRRPTLECFFFHITTYCAFLKNLVPKEASSCKCTTNSSSNLFGNNRKRTQYLGRIFKERSASQVRMCSHMGHTSRMKLCMGGNMVYSCNIWLRGLIGGLAVSSCTSLLRWLIGGLVSSWIGSPLVSSRTSQCRL